MCGISLDCHEMWMLARMVARTVFLMRIRRRRKGDVSRGKGGGGPDDKKGSWGGGRLGVLGGTPQINLCGQLMIRTLTFQKHGYIIAIFKSFDLLQVFLSVYGF